MKKHNEVNITEQELQLLPMLNNDGCVLCAKCDVILSMELDKVYELRIVPLFVHDAQGRSGMTLPSGYTLRCPKCHATQKVRIHED